MSIPYHELVAFAAGEVEGPRAAEIQVLLARDPAAARTVQRYRAALSSVPENPPAHAVTRAVEIYDPARFAGVAPSPIEQVVDLVARLIFDSRAELAPAGLRSPTASFHLTYALTGLDDGSEAQLELEAEPADDDDDGRNWRLVGQISPARPLSLTRVMLFRLGTTTAVAEADVDERGVFMVSAEPGRYDLHFRGARTNVVASDVRIP